MDILIRRVDAGRGSAWIGDAYRLFKQAPLLWIGMVLLLMVAAIVVSEVALIGSIVANLFMPVAYGGLILGCHAQARGEALRFDHLWAGLQSPHFNRLLQLGVAYMVITLIVLVIAFAVIAATLGPAFLSASPEDIDTAAAGIGMLLAVLLVVAVTIPLMMATWFAPALIVLGGQPVIEALKLSFRGCMANLVPFLVYGVISFLILIVAMIPLGLGLLIAAPVIFITTYTGFTDIFEPAAAPDDPTPLSET